MKELIIFNCWNLIYRNAYKEFIRTHETKMREYIKDQNFEEYYDKLGREIDLFEITDDQFYGILSTASGVDPIEIKAFMNKTEGMLNEDIVDLVKDLKSRCLAKIILVADADKDFFQKFADYKDVKKNFDDVITSSQVGSSIVDKTFFEKIGEKFGVNLPDMLMIDASEKRINEIKNFGVQTILYENIEQLKKETESALSEDLKHLMVF